MAAPPLAVDTAPHSRSSDDVADGLLKDSDFRKDGREHGPEYGHSPRLWQPFFLRRSTFLVFIATFVALLATIVALYCYAARGDGRQGIETQGWKHYYLWTYGPTAVFMVLGAFWGQVEYRGCQLMPWLLMSRAPVAASDGLLLDYLSPWNIESLYRSVRRRHYLVSLVIAGTLLVNGMAIVSTSFFELRDVPIKRSASLRLTHDINFRLDNFRPPDVTTIPHMRAMGIALNGSDLPIGILANHVFPPFQEDGPFRPDNFTLGDNREIEAEVDVLTVKVQCENATMEATKNQSEYTLSMKSGSCSTGPLPQQVTQYTVFRGVNATFVGFPSLCDGKRLHFPQDEDQYTDAYWRIWVYIPRHDPNGLYLNATIGSGKKAERGAGKFAFTCAFCTPYLDVARVPVKLSRSSDGISIITDIDMKKQRPLSHSSPPALDVNAGALLYGAWISMLKADGNGWSLLGRRSGDREAFYDPALLSQELGRGLESSAIQVARDQLLQPVDRHIKGTTERTESRLFVRQLSFGLMIGFLSVLIIISVVIDCFYLPLSVCCRDPSSIGGLATILARSPKLMATLRNMNLKWPSEMKELLAGCEHRTCINVGREFQIEVHDQRTSHAQVSKSGTDSTPRWWRPVSARPPVYILTFVLPLVVIATIEVLLHISNTRRGIAPVGGRENGRDQPWAYVPAIVMFCIRVLYQMMEANVRTFQPFHCLARGRARANASVLENQHRKITAWAILDSLGKRQWALAASAVALLLAGALPITVSGLYAVNNLPYPTDISLVQRSTWNVSSYKQHLDHSKYLDLRSKDFTPGRILYLNMSYPQWTYADLAFPKLSLPRTDDNGTSNLTPGYIQARLPAWRPNLNCDGEIPASDYKLSWSHDDDDGLLRWDVEINSTRGACSFSLHEKGVGAPKYFSDWFNLTQNVAYEGNPADCPTLLYLFGNQVETRMLKCRPQIQEVDVDVRLEPRSLMINPNHPPSIVPGSARPPLDDFMAYSNGTMVPIPFLPGPGFFDPDFIAVQAPRKEYRIDFFTTAAIWGAGGIPADELLSDTGKLSATLTRIYGIVIAQRINDNWHIPFGSDTTTTAPDGENSSPTNFPAKLIGHGDYLVQSRLSTRLLDAFLLCMVILAVTSTLLMNTKNILPKNPCSIAAVASLLAGSRIVEDPQIIPQGAEWWDDKELVKRGVFVGWRFSIRWWVRRRQGPVADDGGDGNGVERERERYNGEGDGLLEEEKVFGIDVHDRESA
ncbi:hypothetical protein CIHG_04622 [Coccidioides immitis H538.4]|uniref:Uncharacterized protein n=1 Tax=Coccidioides immitis H538.4 TaxID=396776 RepID=A0A0J8UHC9_COCIT|nr:hypothetical protein CIHG_04622 [Coccidioides immitis H538.4]